MTGKKISFKFLLYRILGEEAFCFTAKRSLVGTLITGKVFSLLRCLNVINLIINLPLSCHISICDNALKEKVRVTLRAFPSIYLIQN